MFSCRAGGTARLPRLVGKSIAKELIFTGRKVSGRDALSIGMIASFFKAQVQCFIELRIRT